MKYIIALFTLVCSYSLANAQGGAPKKFNYQAVPRLADGTLLDAGSAVKIQFVLTEDGPVNIKYGEEHVTTVSQHGVVNAVVGGGSVSGILPFNFNVLDWANHSYFLSASVDLNGNGTFESSEKFASSQLLSVPYALYAAQSGSGSGAVTYQWGNGIDIDSTTFTINNTGDLNEADDVLKTSQFTLGDVTGSYNTGLEIKPNAITTAEIANQTIQKEDLSSMGAANGQVLKWNGTSWEPAADLNDGGSGGADVTITGLTGIQVSETTPNVFTVMNTGDVNPTDDLTNASTAGGDVNGSFSNLQINSGAVGSFEIQNASIEAVDLGQMGATANQVLTWDGAKWTPLTPSGGPGGGLSTVAIVSPLYGNGTVASPIGINNNSIGSNLIQDAGITSVDLNAMGAIAGQVLKYNGSAWAPSIDETGASGNTVNVSAPISGNGSAASPITIAPNSLTSGLIQDGSVAAIDLAPGVIPTSLPPNGAASGDLSGTYPGPMVDGLQGYPVSAVMPANNDVLKWNGTAWAPAPDATSGGGGGDNWGTQVAYTAAPLNGNGTSANPIGLVAESITSGHIQNGTITASDLAAGVVPSLTEGAGIDIVAAGGNYTITNTAPDVPITITGSGGTTVSGTYPNFNISSAGGGGGSVGGSGTTGYLPVFTGPTTLGNSIIHHNSGDGVDIEGNLAVKKGEIRMESPTGQRFSMVIRSDGKMAFEANGTAGDNTLVIDDDADKSVNIGTDVPLTGFKLHVVGKAKFDNGVYLGTSEYLIDGGSSQIASNASFRPSTHLGYSLGTLTNRWNTVFAGFGEYNTAVAIGAPLEETNHNLLVDGFESNGTTTSALKIRSGAYNMLIDGNEIDCASGSLHLNGNTTYNVHMVNGGGMVGIGTQSPTAKLSVNGTANKTGGGTWTTFSDRRLKERVAAYGAGIEVLEKIRPVTFHYNGKLETDTKPEYVGVIAQEVQEVAPYMVSEFTVSEGAEKGESYLSFDPNAFTYMLINAAKTQQAEIKTLTETVAAQQKQIDMLLHQMEALNSAILSAKVASDKQK